MGPPRPAADDDVDVGPPRPAADDVGVARRARQRTTTWTWARRARRRTTTLGRRARKTGRHRAQAQAALEFEQLYLENLPVSEMYEKSYMHRDVVTDLLVTPNEFIMRHPATARSASSWPPTAAVHSPT